MLSLSRLRTVAVVRMPAIPWPRTPAGRVVALAFAASFVLTVGFVARFASRVPFHDEYANFHLLFGKPSLADFWHQHNEHRIPLPRLVYVAAVRLTWYDFRAPLVVDLALLGAATAYLLASVRRERGRFVATDAFIPLVALGLGNADNLLWGFQVQFILSTSLVLVLLGLGIRHRVASSSRRLAIIGLLASLLPLCGANGIPFGVAVGSALVLIGYRNLRASDPALRAAGASGLGGGLIALGLVATVFVGLNRTPHPPGTSTAFAEGCFNLPGFGFGPAAYLPHGDAYGGLTAVGVVTTLLLAATGVHLLRKLRDPDRWDQALLLAAVLVGVAGLAAGVSHGRSGYARGVFAGRYVTLFVPGLVAAYLAWSHLARGAGRWIVPLVLTCAGLVAVVPNAWFAAGVARFHSDRLRRMEYEMRERMPVAVAADRNPWLFPGEPEARRVWLELLRGRGVVPFRSMTPDVRYAAETVPLRVTRVEGLDEDAGEYSVAKGQGGLVLALPRREHVHAVRLIYSASGPKGGFPRSVVSWDRDGHIPPAPGFGILDAIDGHHIPSGSVILIDRETDTLRIDLFETGARIRPIAIELLTRPE